VAVPAGAAGAGGPEGALPVYGNASALSKIFNPDIAVVGNFVGAAGKNHVNPIPSLALNEAEASFQAVVDPYARADFFISMSPEGAEVEEGFITLTSLPGGLLAKVGRMKEQVGKVNTLHPHALAWTDVPLVMTNLFGGDEGMVDSGISVSKLILNPFVFLEATGEVYQGTAGPFQAGRRSDVSWVGRLRGYRDVTESTNLDVGASFASGHNGLTADSRTHLFGVDATFRYRPLRRAIYRRLLARTELFWSRRDQPAEIGGDQHAFGYYLSTDYQFARLVCGRAIRRIRPGRGRRTERHRGVVCVDLLAERVQPGPGAAPPDKVRRGRHGQRGTVPGPILDWGARRPRVLTTRCLQPD
jgi:hypothetical protein